MKNKFGLPDTIGGYDPAPTKIKETSPGIIRMAIGKSIPSLNSPKERMGAAKPWKPKGGHASAAASARDPGTKGPSMKVGRGAGYDDPNGYTMNSSTKPGYTKG